MNRDNNSPGINMADALIARANDEVVATSLVDYDNTVAVDIRESMAESACDSTENKIRPIEIKQLNYGYIVNVGCHAFAIQTYETVSEMIAEYMADPNGTERKWYANELKLKRTR